MDRIASFTINHLDLMPGLYVSRRDAKGDCVTTTFDLRITAPNREPVVDTPALHTIEHLAATYLRNSEKKDDVIYFGPMGCRTGCYLVMFGNLDSEDVLDLVLEMCDFIIGFEGEIPGAAPEQCGNYQEQNLDMAKYFQEIFTCGEVGVSKNEPVIFHQAAALMGTTPEDTCVVEDGLYAVRTANTAGYFTVGVYDASSRDDWQDLQKEADLALESLEDVQRIIKELAV